MSSINLSSKNLTDSQAIFSSFIDPSKITSIDLSNNNISKIPPDLSHLTNLKSLNLLNNPLENYELIGRALSTLPKLTELKLDLTSQEHAYLILSQLPNLLFLNGKSTLDDEDDKNNQIDLNDLNDTETDKSSLKSEIPNFNSVTNRITQILTQRNEKTEEFYAEFQGILEKEINLMNNLDNKKKIICAIQRIKFIPVSNYSKVIKEMTQINGNLLVILVYKDENQRFIFRGLYQVNEKEPQYAKMIFAPNCEQIILNVNNVNNFYNFSLSKGDFIKCIFFEEKLKKFNEDIVVVF